MDLSREQAAENRDRIVETAAQLFRERGFEGIGVAEGFRGDIWHWISLDGGLIAGAFLRDPSWLQWPLALQEADFQGLRTQINGLAPDLVGQASSGAVDGGSVATLSSAVDRLQEGGPERRAGRSRRGRPVSFPPREPHEGPNRARPKRRVFDRAQSPTAQDGSLRCRR